MKTANLRKLLLDTFGHLADAQIFALTIWREAGGERDVGKIAVGTVILERVDHRDWDGTTIRTVCLLPYQFSCYLPKDPNFPRLKEAAEDWLAAVAKSASLRACYEIASGMLNGVIPRDTIIAKNHATQYVTVVHRTMMDKLAAGIKGEALVELDKKRWWIRSRHICTIGAHEFYA